MPSVPMQSAGAQTVLALLLGFRMTAFRGQSFTQDGVLESANFLKWHKAQTNSAEYHGMFIGMCALLNFGWHAKSREPSQRTNIACALSAAASYSFAIGCILGKSAAANPTGRGASEQPHPLRILGAVGRYVAMGLMAFEAYKLAQDLPIVQDAKRIFTIADQVARFARAKREQNQRYLQIGSVYDAAAMKGKKVLVVGASKGLGLELVKQLKKDGAQAVATCRTSTPELEGAGAAQIVKDVEVTSTESLKKMAQAITGPLDYIIFNAGIFPNVVDNLDSIQPEAAMDQFNVCGFGPIRCVSVLKAAGLLKGTKVAIISSQAGSAQWRFTQNKDKGGDYGHHMCRAACNIGVVLMSEELKKQQVPLVILHPGFNRTTMTAKYSHIWDIEGAVPPAEGAMRVLHETAKISMTISGQYINCEDGLQIPF